MVKIEEEPKGPAINCPGCGRFSKYLRTYYYYNGNFDCIRIYLRCSKCGEQEIECV